MEATRLRRLDPALERLTPGVVTDLGYLYHVARAPAYRDTPSQTTALAVLNKFEVLDTDVRDREGEVFLLAVKACAISYGNAVSRVSMQFNEEVESARKMRESESQTVRSSQTSGIKAMLAFKLLGIAILALTGFEIARVIGYFVPQLVKSSTGTTIPALVLGAVFVLVGNFISNWWRGNRLQRVIVNYNLRVLVASESQEDRRMEQFRIHWRHASYLWTQYTERELPSDLPSQLLVMECDAESRREWRDQEKTLNQSDLAMVIEKVTTWIRSRRRKTST